VIKPKVLFLCNANSCRTQMAEAFLRTLAGDKFEAFSAGATPTTVDSDVVDVMKEIGVDMTTQRAKDSKDFFGQRFQYVITVCDKTKERCPIFPGAIWMLHWIIPDPTAIAGTEALRLAAIRRVRDEIEDHVRAFVTEHS
jgi:arsenate reductase